MKGREGKREGESRGIRRESGVIVERERGGKEEHTWIIREGEGV